MKIRSLIYVPVLFLAGALTANAANIVPKTSLTKSCKALVDTSKKIPKVPFRGLSERNNKKISKALEKLADEKYDEAIETLTTMLDPKKDQYVRALAAKFIGIAYAQQKGKTVQATKYFTMALDLGKGFLQHKEVQDLTQNVASMHYSNDNKEQALKFLERWMKNSNEHGSQVYLLYAAILADSNRLKESVCPAYWAAVTDKKPNKSAMGIMLNAHVEFKDFKGTIEILKQLILDFPLEKRNWRILASIYMQEEQLEDSLAVMELFYVQGMMETENDYKQLSSNFAFSDIPYRSAVVMKEGIEKGVVKDEAKNWKSAAQYFHVANELDLAIHSYGKAAAKATTGEFDLKQAELLTDRGKYKKAIIAFEKALKKGGLKNPGKAYVRKGLAYYELKQYNRAIETLGKATKYKKSRKEAVQWTGFVKNQKANAAKL